MYRILLIIVLVIFATDCNTKVEKIELHVASEPVYHEDNDTTIFVKVSGVCDFQDINHFVIVPRKGPRVCGYAEGQFKHMDHKTKMRAIEELLTFEGDTSLCALKTMLFNPKVAFINTPKGTQEYSVQVEALYLINIIVMEEPFNYAPTPVLMKDRDEAASVDGPIIKKAFEAYKSWFSNEKHSFSENFGTDIDPLKGSGVYWYY